MTLVEQLREAGLPMGSWYRPHKQAVFDENSEDTGETITARRFVGWTTDQAKADAATELGATVTAYHSLDPTCSGWDVTVTEIVA